MHNSRGEIMKKKNVLSIFILASSFSLLTGVICSGGFNVRETSAAETTPTFVEKVYTFSATDFSTTAPTTDTTIKKDDINFGFTQIQRVDYNGNPQFNLKPSSYLKNNDPFVQGIDKIVFTFAITYNNSNALEVSFGNDETVAGESAKYSTTYNKNGATLTVTPKVTGYKYFKASQLLTGYDLKFKTISIYSKEEVKNDPVTDFTLDKTGLDLNVLDIYKLNPTVLPSTANQGVTYKSSDPTIASIDSKGTIVALKEGTATITATTVAKDTDGNAKEATCAVNVTGKATIAGLREENGSFKNDLSGKKVTLSGVITSIDTAQKQMTIEDNGKAVLLFQMDNVTGYKVGDKVDATGTITSFSGLIEMTGVSKNTVAVTGAAEVPAARKLESTDAASLLGLDSIIFEATGKLE